MEMRFFKNKWILLSILFILVSGLLLAGRQMGLRLTKKTELGPGGDQPTLNKVFKELYRIGGVNFGVGVMEVTIKDVVVGNKEVLITGSYQNDDGKEEAIQIFVGNIDERGVVNWVSKIVDNDKNAVIGSGDNVQVLMDRVRGKTAEIHFFVDVADYEKVVNETTYCKEYGNFCFLAERSVPNMWAYGGLWYKRQRLPEGIPLNALFVKTL